MLRVTTGSDATFMATEYDATLSPRYTWLFNDALIPSNNPKYSGQFTSNLSIRNPQESDAGNYTCDITVGGANGRPLGQLFVCEFIQWKHKLIAL